MSINSCTSTVACSMFLFMIELSYCQWLSLAANLDIKSLRHTFGERLYVFQLHMSRRLYFLMARTQYDP